MTDFHEFFYAGRAWLKEDIIVFQDLIFDTIKNIPNFEKFTSDICTLWVLSCCLSVHRIGATSTHINNTIAILNIDDITNKGFIGRIVHS